MSGHPLVPPEPTHTICHMGRPAFEVNLGPAFLQLYTLIPLPLHIYYGSHKSFKQCNSPRSPTGHPANLSHYGASSKLID
ncbi:hypothetical protein E2C01_012207 [Portunus trituberculatus]|uniref:Uncharacterized protein n=1 Tax=Portunus trituberculatus TaxID=210409 RepID=A0A5B7DDX5_PORTR|nr:hypothetical protein [Portunus trituberculatus]